MVLETTGSIPPVCLEEPVIFMFGLCHTRISGSGVQNIINVESEIDNPVPLISLQMNTWNPEYVAFLKVLLFTGLTSRKRWHIPAGLDASPRPFRQNK